MHTVTELDACLELPQPLDSEWYVDVKTDFHASISVSMWMNVRTGEYRGMIMHSASSPRYREVLAGILSNPIEGAPARPQRVIVNDPGQRKALSKMLKPLGALVTAGSVPDNVVERADTLRPQVMAELSLRLALPPNTPVERLGRLLQGIQALHEIDPWKRLKAPSMIAVQGPDSTSFAVGMEVQDENKGLTILAIPPDELSLSTALEKLQNSAIHLDFCMVPFFGEARIWPRLHGGEQGHLETSRQLNSVLAAIEVTLKCAESPRPQEELVMLLEDLVETPQQVTAVLVPADGLLELLSDADVPGFRPKSRSVRSSRRKSRSTPSKHTMLFKVRMHHPSRVSRTIELSSSQTLHDLHEAIQVAFGFDDDHLYSFFMSNKKWKGECFNDPRSEDSPSADRKKVSELGLSPKAKFLYLFDFGDSWWFDVTFVKEDAAEAGVSYPRIVEAKGENVPQYDSWEDDEVDE